MFTVFDTALSALSAISTAVDVVGNNLANLNTTGFKAGTVQFSDLMGQELGLGDASSQVGMGVMSPTVVTHYTQGTTQQSTGTLDAAISGNGFFVVRDANGQQLYTRAGNFSLDTSGHLVTASGANVQGWNAVGGVVNPNGAVSDIILPTGSVSAVPTTKMSLTVNLNAAGTTGSATGTYSAPIQVVDSLGAQHTLTATFTKTGSNAWSYTVTAPAADLGASAGPLATGSLAFDSSGRLTTPASGSDPVAVHLAGLANGAADQTIDWNLFNGASGLITQFAQDSSVSATNQDGQVAGQITGVQLDAGGLIVAKYSSGQKQTLGQVALAAIENPETLVSVGNNNLAATTTTSAPAIGASGSGGRGKIVAGTLEASTVDIATEFTNLITLQRSYSANSRVITTSDEMLQELMSVKR
jgi:flagellar hook protein FlgE